MTQNLLSVTSAATIIASALKAIYMQCWISVTDNKVSAGVKSPPWQEKDQANFRRVSGLRKSHYQKYHLSVPPLLTWSYHLMQVSRNYIVLFIVLSWTFKMMVCVETLFVLDQHLVVNLGKTTASDSVVKGNGRDCQI